MTLQNEHPQITEIATYLAEQRGVTDFSSRAHDELIAELETYYVRAAILPSGVLLIESSLEDLRSETDVELLTDATDDYARKVPKELTRHIKITAEGWQVFARWAVMPKHHTPTQAITSFTAWLTELFDPAQYA
jgi:hypothetical protein